MFRKFCEVCGCRSFEVNGFLRERDGREETVGWCWYPTLGKCLV